MPVIEVDHLHKQYGDQVAVDDLSFTVERGEIFGILEAGATGYLLKDAPREELIRAVRAAAVAEAYRRRLLT
jgi:DNA-binding NarL/FixJ family response regulator